PEDPVTAPISSFEVPPPAREPPAPPAPTDAAAPTTTWTAETEQPELPPAEDPSAPPAPSSFRAPCAPACTGNTICWVYEHRPPPRPSPTAADAGWAAQF